MPNEDKKYIDITEKLVKQFKDQLEFEKKQREKDEKEFGPDRKKFKRGGSIMARGQGKLSETIKITKIY